MSLTAGQARLFRSAAVAIVAVVLIALTLAGSINLPVFVPLLLLVVTAGLVIGAARGG